MITQEIRASNELLPWGDGEYQQPAAEHILAVSEFAAKADAYFEAEAERVLRESERKEKIRTGNSVKIRTEILDPQPEILKTYIIRRMILNAAGKAKDTSERHIRLVHGSFRSGRPAVLRTFRMVCRRSAGMRHWRSGKCARWEKKKEERRLGTFQPINSGKMRRTWNAQR